MADILILTNEQLISGSPLGGNIDIDKYQSVIKETQVLVIEPILGTKLYNKVLADFDANTLAGDYLELHTKYLVPVLVHSVAAEYITVASFNVANGGVFRYSPQDAIPASMSEISKLADNERAKADIYIQRLQDYLCNKNIAEYDAPQDNTYDVKKDTNVGLMGGWRLSSGEYYGSNAEREIWRDILNDEGR